MKAALILCALAGSALADDWTGVIDVPGGAMGFTAHLEANSGTIDIQGKQGIPLANVAVTATSVHFEIAAVGATFDGPIANNAVDGRFAQNGAKLAFHMQHGKPAAGPPPPRIPLSTKVGAALLGTWRGTATATGQAPAQIEMTFVDDHGLVKGAFLNRSACDPPVPIENLALLMNHLTASVTGLHGTALADLTIAGEAMDGTAVQLGIELAVHVARAPAAPRPRELEVAIPSAKGVTLAGTLTLPDAPHPPVVVLVTGSGPQNRDECVVGVRPFAQLAAHLAAHGIATLRYDDRGTAKSTGDFATATGGDFADDAQAAVAFLAARDAAGCTEQCGVIDARHIGILGHSEGGMIAPIVAARDKRVAFIVLWAGPGVPLDQVIVQQSHDIALAEGHPAKDVERDDRLEKLLWSTWHTAKDRAAFEAQLAAIAAKEPDAKDPKALAREQANVLWTPWFRWYKDFDPAKTLAKVRVPILAINGGLDMQVNPKINLKAIRRAAPRAEIVELPGLNHLFQPTKTGAVSEYGKASLDIDPAVLDATTAWIVKSVK